MNETVTLKCIKEGSRLRIKIVTPGYNNNANCQFPKAIRADGKMFTVPAHAITVSGNEGRGFFYRVNKNHITEITNAAATAAVAVPEKVYNTNDCVVCLDDGSAEMVIVPCGHLCMCRACSAQVKDYCPMCRGRISNKIHKDQLQ